MDNNKQYIKPISIDEYSKQGKEHTAKALKELQDQIEQMPIINRHSTRKPLNLKDYTTVIPERHFSQTEENIKSIKINNISNDSSDDNDNSNDDNDDYNTNNEISGVNTIKDSINDVINKLNKAKVSSKSNKALDNIFKMDMENVVKKQLEKDSKIISMLNDKLSGVNKEIDDLERCNHFLKLDLNNATCEVGDLKNENTLLKIVNIENKEKIEKMESVIKSNNFKLKICYLAIIILFILAIIF